MENKNLYIIICILILLNVFTLTYTWSGMRTYRQFAPTNEMLEHMREEHDEIDVMHRSISYNKPVVETHKNTYDFGQVKKSDGIVNTTFKIENHGREILQIGEITTSCGCTSAEVNEREIGFNEEAIL